MTPRRQEIMSSSRRQQQEASSSDGFPSSSARAEAADPSSSSSTDITRHTYVFADLIEWINTKPHFAQKTKSVAPYLYKPDWTEEDLKNGLRYAIDRVQHERELYLSTILEARELILLLHDNMDYHEIPAEEVATLIDFDDHNSRANPKIGNTILSEEKLIAIAHELHFTGLKEGCFGLVPVDTHFRRAVFMCVEGRWMIHDACEELTNVVKQLRLRALSSSSLLED